MSSDLEILPARDCPPNLEDYERARATFAVHVPERFNPVLGIVEGWAREDPDALALVSCDGRGDLVAAQSAADLARASRTAARALLDAGIEHGDHVFVMLPRSPEWYAAMLGTMRIGAVPMPGPNLLTAKDIADRLRRARAKGAVVAPSGAERVDATGHALTARLCVGGAPAGWTDFAEACGRVGDGPTPQDPTHRDDPLVLYFTSGTTSMPKMVQHTQAYGLGHVATARFWHDLRRRDRHWTVTDTGWAKAAWGGLFGQFHERATVVQVDLGRPDADTVFSILARHRITSFCAPPTLYRLLVQTDPEGYDLSALRHCTSAGEALNPEVIRAWRAGTGGLTVYEAYGQTETCCLVANYRAVEVRPGSMGKPMPGWNVAVVDDAGAPVAEGTVSNIVVGCAAPRPLGLFDGYHEDVAATAQAFRGPWYFTGDRAAIDGDGYLWFEGRSDDVITSSAYRIGPFEVESALQAHPAVAEAAVVGRPDAARTEVVVGVCVLAAGHRATPALARELQDFVKQHTAPYKYPREIHFVAELPKTISGKIRRAELRTRLADGRLPAADLSTSR